jgi:hypothetical protein
MEKSDAPRQPIDGECVRTDQLGQRSAHDAQQGLELEGTILALTEAQSVPGIGVCACCDVRHAPAIAPDDDLGLQPWKGQHTVGKREAAAQK